MASASRQAVTEHAKQARLRDPGGVGRGVGHRWATRAEGSGCFEFSFMSSQGLLASIPPPASMFRAIISSDGAQQTHVGWGWGAVGTHSGVLLPAAFADPPRGRGTRMLSSGAPAATWTHILALVLAGRATLAVLFDLSEPQWTHLGNGASMHILTLKCK